MRTHAHTRIVSTYFPHAFLSHARTRSDELVRGISSHVPELEVIGEPEMGVVAFRARPGHPARLNVYVLNDHLTKQGWHMNALQVGGGEGGGKWGTWREGRRRVEGWVEGWVGGWVRGWLPPWPVRK